MVILADMTAKLCSERADRGRDHAPGDGRERGVDLRQRTSVPVGIPPMAIEHVGIDQVDEEEARQHRLQHFRGPAQSVRISLGVHRLGDALAVVDVGDLAQPHGPHALLRQAIQDRSLRRRLREVPAIVGALEPSLRVADERPRDDARQPIALADGTSGVAPGVQRLERDLLLLRGDLEDAVRAGVDDGHPGAEVLLAQLVEDDGAARRPVAEEAGRPGEAQPFVHQLLRESARERGESALQHHPHHFPVPGGGVLALRLLRHAAESSTRGIGPRAAGDPGNIAQPP